MAWVVESASPERVNRSNEKDAALVGSSADEQTARQTD